MTEWPDMPTSSAQTNVYHKLPVGAPSYDQEKQKEIDEIMELLEPIHSPTPLYESKSPMKYAVDYKLVDEDGNVMKDTDYFLLKDEAWARATELYEASGLQGTITFREL